MGKTLTKEDLLQIKLPLSETDFQMLKSRRDEWDTHQNHSDKDLDKLYIAFLDELEIEKLNDPKWPSGAGYGDL